MTLSDPQRKQRWNQARLLTDNREGVHPPLSDWTRKRPGIPP